MQPCNKRQTVVKRGNGTPVTFYRCLNKQCGFSGQEVCENVCSSCPVRSVAHKPPCSSSPRPAVSNPNIVSTEEMLKFTDAEVRQMMHDADMQVDEVDEALDAAKGSREYPVLSMQLWTYKEAILRWNKAGRPKRSQEEVNMILETHCKGGCKWYDPVKSRCRGCGCSVSASSIAIFNKVKMGTEHCPKELW